MIDTYIEEEESRCGRPFNYADHRDLSSLIIRVLEETDFPRTHSADRRAMRAVIELAECIDGDNDRRAALCRATDHICAKIQRYI